MSPTKLVFLVELAGKQAYSDLRLLYLGVEDEVMHSRFNAMLHSLWSNSAFESLAPPLLQWPIESLFWEPIMVCISCCPNVIPKHLY